jgi:hypothetical protein
MLGPGFRRWKGRKSELVPDTARVVIDEAEVAFSGMKGA